MRWRKLCLSRLSPIPSRLPSSPHRIRLQPSQLSNRRSKPRTAPKTVQKPSRQPTRPKSKNKRATKKPIGLQRLGSMPTKSTNPTMRLTKLFPSSIVKILAGKPMFASFPRNMLTTVHTALPKRRLRISHNSTISQTLTLKREERDLSLVRKEVRTSEKPCPKCNNGSPIIPLLMKSQTT